MADASGITIAVIVVVFIIFICCPAIFILGCPAYICIKSLCEEPSQPQQPHRRRNNTQQAEAEDTMNYRDSTLFHDPPPTYDHCTEYPTVESPTRTPHTARREVDDPPSGSLQGADSELEEQLQPPPDYTSQVVDLEATRINGDSISRRNESGLLNTVLESELPPPPDYTSQVVTIDVVPTTSRGTDEELYLHTTILEDEPLPSDHGTSLEET